MAPHHCHIGMGTVEEVQSNRDRTHEFLGLLGVRAAPTSSAEGLHNINFRQPIIAPTPSFVNALLSKLDPSQNGKVHHHLCNCQTERPTLLPGLLNLIVSIFHSIDGAVCYLGCVTVDCDIVLVDWWRHSHLPHFCLYTQRGTPAASNNGGHCQYTAVPTAATLQAQEAQNSMARNIKRQQDSRLLYFIQTTRQRRDMSVPIGG